MSEVPVSNSRLVVGIIENMDIAQNLGNAVTFALDVARAAPIKAQVDTQISEILAATQDLTSMLNMDGEKIVKAALAAYKAQMPSINQYLLDIAVQGAAGYKITSSMMAENAKFFSEMEHLDLFQACLSDIPETYVKAQVIRWYNKAAGIAFPAEHDRYMLMMNSYWTSQNYVDAFRTEEGFDLADATALAKIRNWQYGVPDPRTAWVMVQRGLWGKNDFYNLMQLGQGWAKEDVDALFQVYAYDPTFSDVMNLSTLVPLDPTWVAQKFQRSGMTAADQAVFISAMNKSVVLREIRQAWAQILSMYVYGAFTEDELTKQLKAWSFPQAEIDIKIETAELLKAKTVNSLLRDADIYLYRQKVIDEDTLFLRLIAQQIPEEVANAIVRSEACKLSNDWEMNEVTPYSTVLFDDYQTLFWAKTADIALTDDSTTFKWGLNALKIAYAAVVANDGIYKFYSASQNWDSFTQVILWVCGQNTGNVFSFSISTDINSDSTLGATYKTWNLTDNFYGWQPFKFLFLTPGAQAGVMDMTAIRKLLFQFVSGTSTTQHIYIDRGTLAR